MAENKLSDMGVRKAGPGPKVKKLGDGLGMFLQIETNGSKLWRIGYRFDGKQKTLSLGPYPAVSLKDARLKRDDARALLAKGVDPSAARKADRVVEVPEVLPTWREVAEEFEAKRKREKVSPATAGKLAWFLAMTYPHLGTRPIAQIKAVEVLKVLREVEARGHYETANRMRATISRVFRYAVATARAERDIASDLRGALTTPPERHHPAITDPKGIGGLMRACRGYEGSHATRAGLLICFYTFLRPGEVRHLEWADYDKDAAQIKIPADRMKMPRPHIVPLSKQVVAVLESMRPISGRNKLILTSLRATNRPMSENTLNAALRRLGYTGDEMTSHGFRTIASTLLNEQGFNRDWVERQLAHIEGNAVRRAYNAAEYLEGRTAMMQSWADYLDGLADAPA